VVCPVARDMVNLQIAAAAAAGATLAVVLEDASLDGQEEFATVPSLLIGSRVRYLVGTAAVHPEPVFRLPFHVANRLPATLGTLEQRPTARQTVV
jgi:hypothetical protein